VKGILPEENLSVCFLVKFWFSTSYVSCAAVTVALCGLHKPLKYHFNSFRIASAHYNPGSFNYLAGVTIEKYLLEKKFPRNAAELIFG